jgi:hypothetical protein
MEVNTMDPLLPSDLDRLAKAKEAEYEAEAERERLLEEARALSGLRRRLALLLYRLAERLAPEIRRFNQPNLARSEPQRRVSRHKPAR